MCKHCCFVLFKVLKITTIEELGTLKESLDIDEYLQEYIYNPNDLIDNRVKFYRSVDLIYGSNLKTFR